MTYPVHTYPPDEDQPCTCPLCGCRTDVLHFCREDYPVGGGKFSATVEECPECGYTFVYEVDMTRYESTPDAFELIMERLIKQKERELEARRDEYADARRSVSQYATIEETLARPFMLRAEGHLEGLRAALAKYREEGGRDVITPEQQGRLEFLSALEAAGVDNWSGYGDAFDILEEWNAE